MREPRYRRPMSASVIILISLAAVFALQIVDEQLLHLRLERWLALTADGLKHGFVWQLLTFQFLHGGILHLACNALGIWFFGRFVEYRLGVRRFLFAYFGAGVAGGLLQGVLMVLFPGHYGTGMYGASAGVAGVFALFAMLESEAEVRVYFVIPVRARTLLWIFGVISVVFTIWPAGGDYTAHAAHLGGLLFGLWFVRRGWHWDYQPLPWEGVWERLQGVFRRPASGAKVLRPEFGVQGRSKAVGDELATDFISRDVDPILDKISTHGIQSLTPRERKILDAAKDRMNRR